MKNTKYINRSVSFQIARSSVDELQAISGLSRKECENLLLLFFIDSDQSSLCVWHTESREIFAFDSDEGIDDIEYHSIALEVKVVYNKTLRKTLWGGLAK